MPETSLSFLEQLQREELSGQWNRLVALYSPLLQSWLSRYKDLAGADRDDLVQETLLVVSQEFPKFEHNQKPGAFRNWLKTILIYRLRDFWRGRQNRPVAMGGNEILVQLDELEDQNSAVSRMWDEEHDRHVLNELLTLAQPHFSAQTWDAFRQLMLQGATAGQVAKNLEMNIGAVYAAKSRVLATLRKMADGLIS